MNELYAEIDRLNYVLNAHIAVLTTVKAENKKLRAENKELKEQLWVFQNTPFAHWKERAEKAEAEIATRDRVKE